MSINQKLILRRLIEEEVNRLFEQEEPPAAEPAAGTDTPDDEAGTDISGDAGGDDIGDIDLGDAGGGAGGMGGGAGGGGIGDLGDGTETTDDAETMDDVGGGSGFGGFGGKKSFDFGSSGSADGLIPDDADDSGEENTGKEKDTATTVGPEDVGMPADPVMATVESAIKMLDTTQTAAPILNNVKYSIQKYFNNFDDATPVIKALWDTEDVLLRDVAKRLLIFMRGN
jgi:hypothetical protein